MSEQNPLFFAGFRRARIHTTCSVLLPKVYSEYELSETGGGEGIRQNLNRGMPNSDIKIYNFELKKKMFCFFVFFSLSLTCEAGRIYGFHLWMVFAEISGRAAALTGAKYRFDNTCRKKKSSWKIHFSFDTGLDSQGRRQSARRNFQLFPFCRLAGRLLRYK